MLSLETFGINMRRRHMHAVDIRCGEANNMIYKAALSSTCTRGWLCCRRCPFQLNLANAGESLWRWPARPSNYAKRFMYMDNCALLSLGFGKSSRARCTSRREGLRDSHYRACVP